MLCLFLSQVNENGPLQFLLYAITITVVSIPEGLPLAVTLTLAYSMKKMMNDNSERDGLGVVAAVELCGRKLCGAQSACRPHAPPPAQTLCACSRRARPWEERRPFARTRRVRGAGAAAGRVRRRGALASFASHVRTGGRGCAGTLTENRMTVVEAWVAGKYWSSLPEAEQLPPGLLELLAGNSAMNSKAFLVDLPTSTVDFVGNRTECALLMLLRKFNVDYQKVRDELLPSQIRVSGVEWRGGGLGVSVPVVGPHCRLLWGDSVLLLAQTTLVPGTLPHCSSLASHRRARWPASCSSTATARSGCTTRAPPSGSCAGEPRAARGTARTRRTGEASVSWQPNHPLATSLCMRRCASHLNEDGSTTEMDEAKLNEMLETVTSMAKRVRRAAGFSRPQPWLDALDVADNVACMRCLLRRACAASA